MNKPNHLIKRWFLFCEPCSHKQIIEEDLDKVDLIKIKTVKIPGGAPVLDPKTKKAKAKPDHKRPEMFKCPKCGRGVVTKRLPDVYVKAYKKIDDDELKKKQEEEKTKRVLDGKPEKRKPESEFLKGKDGKKKN